MTTTSFPYLKLARDTGASYGSVLRISDDLWSMVDGSVPEHARDVSDQIITDYERTDMTIVAQIARVMADEGDRRQRVKEETFYAECGERRGTA